MATSCGDGNDLPVVHVDFYSYRDGASGVHDARHAQGRGNHARNVAARLRDHPCAAALRVFNSVTVWKTAERAGQQHEGDF